MSTWEERMAAKAASRQTERDLIARAAEALRRAEEDRQHAEWVASFPPCPCGEAACRAGFPGWPGDQWWTVHRRYWERYNQTGRCPDCHQPMNRQTFGEHDCPNAPPPIAIAG